MALNCLHQLQLMCVFITAEVALTRRDTPLLLDAHLWIIPAGDVVFFYCYFFPFMLKKKTQTVCTSGKKVHLLVLHQVPAGA